MVLMDARDAFDYARRCVDRPGHEIAFHRRLEAWKISS